MSETTSAQESDMVTASVLSITTDATVLEGPKSTANTTEPRATDSIAVMRDDNDDADMSPRGSSSVFAALADDDDEVQDENRSAEKTVDDDLAPSVTAGSDDEGVAVGSEDESSNEESKNPIDDRTNEPTVSSTYERPQQRYAGVVNMLHLKDVDSGRPSASYISMDVFTAAGGYQKALSEMVYLADDESRDKLQHGDNVSFCLSNQTQAPAPFLLEATHVKLLARRAMERVEVLQHVVPPRPFHEQQRGGQRMMVGSRVEAL